MYSGLRFQCCGQRNLALRAVLVAAEGVRGGARGRGGERGGGGVGGWGGEGGRRGELCRSVNLPVSQSVSQSVSGCSVCAIHLRYATRVFKVYYLLN
jgi:hypothetical protein